MTEPAPTPKPRTDWEGVEREYRAGQLSIREVGRTFEVSEGAIRKRAKAEGWTRALAAKVRAATAEKLVREPSTQAGTQDGTQSPRARTDAEIIETAAARGVELVRQHRTALGRAGAVVGSLIEELEEATKNRDDIAGIIDEVAAKDARRRAMMHRAVELPSRAQTATSLSMAMKNLIGLERQAFNLDEPGAGAPPEKTPLEELRDQISGRSFRPVE